MVHVPISDKEKGVKVDSSKVRDCRKTPHIHLHLIE